ncbi:meiotically up-regulated protein [Ceratobasidium sp. AG-Ba]|nr:meiotically up-regulated protein [Ceratobasidium sp. AG-Ba]
MTMFRRRHNSDEGDDGEGKKGKTGSKEPANTAFKQQRLKAWQPILTPKTVLPILFIVGLCFAPIGGLLIWGSGNVSQITLEYTDCENAGSTQANLPKYSYDMRSSDSSAPVTSLPKWQTKSIPESRNSSGVQCVIQFELPADLHPPVFMYYRLTSFYQNHRRYVKSMDSDQLKGKAVDAGTLNGGDCKPLAVLDGKIVYPCGLIANSMFNDTISNPTLTGASSTYEFSNKGIAWPGEAKKYAARPGYTDLSQIIPPPNWQKRFPNNYTETDLPNLHEDEHFQNWMRTAGLPTFTKLYGRNDNTVMQKGTYQITVDLNFPVSQYGGTKAIVISTVSWIGGKNPFLGWAYIAVAALFVLLGIAGTARHLLRPRKLGDMNMLSWNQPAQTR